MQVGHQEGFLDGKGCEALKWAAREVMEPAALEEMTGCDTQGQLSAQPSVGLGGPGGLVQSK